jgi:uncharacterized protein Veg
MKNKEWLAETTNNMLKSQNSKLKVGQIVRVGFGEKRVREIKDGTIEEVNNFHILVKFKNYKESYSYTDIITSLYNKTVDNLMILVKINGSWERVTEEMIK